MAIIKNEYGFGEFKPWSGGVYLWEYLEKIPDGIERLEGLIDEVYDGEIDETQLNDLLWFEGDWICESLFDCTEEYFTENISEFMSDN